MAMAHTTNYVEGRAGTSDVMPATSVGTYGGPQQGTTCIARDTPIVGTPWRLAVNLYVDLEFTGSGVIASSPWVGDSAQGANEEEATRNLLKSLADFRESIERRRQRAPLSEELADALSKLELLLVM
jgi:hypothetical protein